MLHGTSDRFNLIVNKLWRAVGVKILFETLSRLSSNEKVSYGRKGLLVDKDGILLHRFKLLSANEPVHCKWEDLTYGGHSGSLHISSKSDKKLNAELSYRDDDNTHILESIMDFLFKDGNHLKLRRGEFK